MMLSRKIIVSKVTLQTTNQSPPLSRIAEKSINIAIRNTWNLRFFPLLPLLFLLRLSSQLDYPCYVNAIHDYNVLAFRTSLLRCG